jgi:hypothetical protein
MIWNKKKKKIAKTKIWYNVSRANLKIWKKFCYIGYSFLWLVKLIETFDWPAYNNPGRRFRIFVFHSNNPGANSRSQIRNSSPGLDLSDTQNTSGTRVPRPLSTLVWSTASSNFEFFYVLLMKVNIVPSVPLLKFCFKWNKKRCCKTREIYYIDVIAVKRNIFLDRQQNKKENCTDRQDDKKA